MHRELVRLWDIAGGDEIANRVSAIAGREVTRLAVNAYAYRQGLKKHRTYANNIEWRRDRLLEV